jgi:polysaccharide export outer membrane protein
MTALYAGGGVKPIGSLRNIRLLRDGATVATLDLYDLLLRGDTRGDVRLQAGDAIFVPPIGAQVTVAGEVRRPAIYEVKEDETVAELVTLAGGLNAVANRGAVKLERVVPNRGTTVQDIDLATGAAQTAVRDGDVLRIPANLDQIESSVRLAGNVFQPGLHQWRQGMSRCRT